MSLQENQTAVQYKKVSTKEKYCFGIGAIGKDAICNLVGAFLMVYFTDTLYLAPAFVGILFFAARIWDAVNDPMMGMIVDNTHTKYGKFRIWLVIGTLINSVVFVLLFHSFNLQGTALYVYVSVMYILYGMTYTIMDVPYWSWLPNLTNDPHEREKVSVIPRFFASLAGFSVSTFGLYIIHGFNKMAGEKDSFAETGFTIFAIVIAVIFIITIGITVCNVKEESTVGEKASKTSFKEAIQVIIKNDQLLAFIGLLLTFNLCTQIAKSFAVYYFKNVCGNEYLYSIFGFAIIAEMAGLVCFPKIAEKIMRYCFSVPGFLLE
ncbi:MAG: glycoside-pentoside-hexuronide (GPH):cation symporter [Lachnospiraceae bacterium]